MPIDDGYAGDPVVAGEGLLRMPGFWAAYLQAAAGILECNLSPSPRHGIRLAQGITREQSDRLARALGTWPE